MCNKADCSQIEKLIAYCLEKPGAYEDYPFGPEPLVIKMCGKMFAIFYLCENENRVTLKCMPEFGDFMKQIYCTAPWETDNDKGARRMVE